MSLDGTLEGAFYLGDGAYVRHGSYAREVIIFTHNGVYSTNSVCLGPDELNALQVWLKLEHSNGR